LKPFRRRDQDQDRPRRRAGVPPQWRTDRAVRLREETRAAARSGRKQLLVVGPLLAGVLYVYDHQADLLPGLRTPVQVVTVIALVVLGWSVARDLARAVGPQLLGRLDPATAGSVDFLVRLVGMAAAVLAALRIAGIPPETLAVGGAFTAVIFGLAAQQTLGNLIAGTVLISARPFRVGDRVKLQAGGLAGDVQGTVSSLGLLYTTLQHGADAIMVPNSVVLSAAVVPLREPAAVDFLARLRQGVRPSDVQGLLRRTITVPTRVPPHIDLEELDDDEVVVRITAVPVDDADGWRLADEVLAAVDQVTRGEVTTEHVLGRPRQPG
jgi:small conductance mechanosensitive channel